jgi:DNA repair protein RadC
MFISELQLKFKKGKVPQSAITDSKSAEEIIRLFFDKDTLEYTESALALYFDNARNVLGWKQISQGGITGTVMDPRTIFSAALLCGATSFMVAHNHPSGKLIPSDADKAITKQLIKGGNILQIQLLDHIIIAADGYYSFGDNGLMH